MDFWMGLCFHLVLFTMVSGQDEGSGEIEPINAEIGESLVLPGMFDLDEGEAVVTLVWKFGEENIIVLLKDDITLNGKYKQRATVDESTFDLTLTNVGFGDAGEYTCILITSSGAFIETIPVNVFAVPQVSVEALPVSLKEESMSSREKKVLAQCTVIGGSPPFSMKWVTYPGKDLVIGNNFRNESTNSENDQLVDAVLLLEILPDPFRNDGRLFSCVVEDAIGRETVHQITTNIKVVTSTPPTTTMQASPVIVSFPVPDGTSVTMNIDETRSFACEATGVPTPHVTWYRGTEKLSDGVGKAMLRLDVQTLDLAGQHICIGKNKEGTAANSLNLIVQGAPVIISDNEWINGTEVIKMEPESEVVTISCKASAFPIPEIIWEIETINLTDAVVDKELVVNDNTISSTVNLTLFHDDDVSKRVKCIVENSRGKTSKEFIVKSTSIQKSSMGLIVGIVIAVIVIIALILIVVYATLASKRKRSANLSETEKAEKGCVTCTSLTSLCVGSNPPQRESGEGQDNEQANEVHEEGTKEEKQKLTEAEEQPAEKDKESSSSENEAPIEEAVKQEKPKKTVQLPFPWQCCHNNKKKLKEDNSVHEEDAQDPLNDKKSEEKADVTAIDTDSGKGDTLENMVEETAK